MTDHYTRYKIELLEKHSTSRELYKVLEAATEQYYWETDDNSLLVDDVPHGAGYIIESVLSLLNDLATYKRMYRCDETIPDDLAYITPFIEEA
jgi:hypothetical protein